ncbi:MAG: FIST C-terminal domain-containing protein [Deltaproteobacteria bacterium]|nr:FIST C-terminal domain-containing protein [Deltaproteobacteria bacterium]
MTRAIAAVSTRAELRRAIAEVLDPHGVAHDPPVLCLAYAGVAHDQAALLAALGAALPGTVIAGASSQGATLPGRALEADRFLAVLLLWSDRVTVRRAAVPAIGPDGFAAGQALAAGLGAPPAGPSTTLVFFDPLGGVDTAALCAGLAAGGYRRVYGGGAGQPWGRMVRTYQYAGTEVYTAGAVALTLDGLEAVADLTHGAEAIGLELVATRTEGNRVLELDGRPALDVWTEQLGVHPDGHVEHTANWALGVHPPAGVAYEGLLTRPPFAFDAAARALVFQAAIPTGARVQVCVRTRRAILDGAAAMGARLAGALVGRRPVAALAFEGGSRPAPFLSGEVASAVRADVQRQLPAGLPWLGRYAWGELAPLGDRTELHTYAFPVCILCEPGEPS